MRVLGAHDMTSSDMQLLFQVIDENNDGQVSYGEFTKYVSSIHSEKKIDDQSHVLYAVCEAVRRLLR